MCAFSEKTGIFICPSCEEKPFSCSQCDRNFESEKDLLEHERIHTEEKPYSCSQCGRNFESETILLEHERIHTDKKPYSCSQCDWNFESETILRLSDDQIGPLCTIECEKLVYVAKILVTLGVLRWPARFFVYKRCSFDVTGSEKTLLVTL